MGYRFCVSEDSNFLNDAIVARENGEVAVAETATTSATRVHARSRYRILFVDI